MNKKGQSLGITIMTSIFILIVGFMLINFLMPEVTDFRGNMNCETPSSISDGTKLLCLVGDVVVIYWIVAVLSVVIGGISARLLFK